VAQATAKAAVSAQGRGMAQEAIAVTTVPSSRPVPTSRPTERRRAYSRRDAIRRAMMPYYGFIGARLAINAAAATVHLARVPEPGEALTFTLFATNANIGVAVLICQQYVHNLIFRVLRS
jgi:hypothetical protein